MRKLKRDKCVVLLLVLKRKWYDMIECGEKKIERVAILIGERIKLEGGK
jgi:hypothetical protein